MYLPLFALLLGAFCIGTTELVVAGILPAIATDLGVSIPRAGMLVTGYAVAVAIGGPLMMAVAGRWSRKRGIIGVTLIFMLGHLVCGFAPSFAMLMTGRVIAAAAHGCFFGFAIVLATAGVPVHRRATALSIVVGGVNIANVIGVPLGTAVGNAFGWRATFFMIAACALVAALAIAVLVHDTSTARTGRPLGQQIRALMNRTVLTAYGIIVLQMTAVFALLTFIAPYMQQVAGIGPEGLPAVLLASGVAGTVGVFAGGALVDRAPTAALDRELRGRHGDDGDGLARDARVGHGRGGGVRRGKRRRQRRHAGGAAPHPDRVGPGARARLDADVDGVQYRHRRRRRPRRLADRGRRALSGAAALRRRVPGPRDPPRADHALRRPEARPALVAGCGANLAGKSDDHAVVIFRNQLVSL